jgi:MFS transporter, PAT family, beta-lactamase induction signal transducer AmpG
VPSLYTAEGLPMVTVSVVAGIMYMDLGLPNDVNTLYTGLMYLPWTIKPLWAPLVEMWGTKRRWVIAMQFLLAITLGAVGAALQLPTYLPVTIALFSVAAFLSSTHDIAADGVYISVTTQKEQARLVGAQGIFWNLGRVLAQGALLIFTHELFKRTGNYFASWGIVMATAGVMMAVLGLWHWRILPEDKRSIDAPRSVKEAAATFADTLRTFFAKPGIWRMIIFVVLYRSGEGFLEKIGPLFLKASRETGGLGLDNAAVGHVNGWISTAGFMAGALVGGLWVARYGLKRILLILCLLLNVPSATYIILAFHQPTSLVEITFWVTVEKIGWGVGSVGQMLYMMQQLSPGRYRTAHFAFGTALMAAGVMLPSTLSGSIQMALGYGPFFVFVMVASIPSVVATLFAPFPVKEEFGQGNPPGAAPATNPAH